MPTDWRSAYAAALQESSPEKVLAACVNARRLINDRVLEITNEMSELEEALRQLFVYQVGQCGIAPG